MARAKSEQYLRDYADLAGPVLQLAAWISPGGDGVDASQASLSLRASDENCNSANCRPARLLSPAAAAMALQRGAVGAPSFLAPSCLALHSPYCFVVHFLCTLPLALGQVGQVPRTFAFGFSICFTRIQRKMYAQYI